MQEPIRRTTWSVLPILALLLAGCISDDSEESGGIVAGGTDIVGTFPDVSLPEDPNWVHRARIGGVDLSGGMTDDEVRARLQELVDQNVSVAEVDTDLSQYRKDDAFAVEVAFMARVVAIAHELGLRVAAYYPSLEVITEEGRESASTMFKDHPDWVQVGIDGQPNVFYGSKEVWVPMADESAWMCPHGPYREVYKGRVRQLVAAGIDALWVDVPLYMDTGAPWPCVDAHCDQAFNTWSKERGLGGSAGLRAPKAVDFSEPSFRAWIRWRHESLADFVDDVRQAAQGVNPDIWVIVETFPLDYLDATDKGLDGSYRRSSERFTRVWEVDSVSNTQGMKWATPEDFTGKIAMYKWSKAADGDNPSWAFSYGYLERDAGLVMGAALATGVAPFETRTPIMTESVGADFRTAWFGLIKDHPDLLPGPARAAAAGIWYSSASRDYGDYAGGQGGYGMFVTTEPPIADPDWWATEEADSAVDKPHLGGWRGMAHAMIQLRIPFRPVLARPDGAPALDDLPLLWLPNVRALSSDEVDGLRAWVQKGGLLVATGAVPGELDQLGNPRTPNPMLEVFGLTATEPPADHLNPFGRGLALYTGRPLGRNAFVSFIGPDDAAGTLSEMERIVRIHTEDRVRLEGARWALVETAEITKDRHALYVLNFEGFQQPLKSEPRTLKLTYRPPEGLRVASATTISPDAGSQQGVLQVSRVAPGLFEIELRVDRFAVVDLKLEAEPSAGAPQPYAGPIFADPAREEAAKSGLRFIRERMRDPSLPVPWRYGIWTNLKDQNAPTLRYAHGHLMTSEHMGLYLRAAACMGDEVAYGQGLRFVKELMVDPLFQVPNWAMDPKQRAPVIQQDLPGLPYRNGNAPLDDMRVIRGLLAGGWQAGASEATTLGRRLLRGLYWTSVTDVDRDATVDFPEYPGGLLGMAWNWEGTDDPTTFPPARSRGVGELDVEIIPVDYQDLWVVARAATWEPRWRPVLESATGLLLASEIQRSGTPSGLFWNGLDGVTRAWTGDFENPDNAKGKHLKVIQELWTALHLARASKLGPELLNEARRVRAEAAASRSLAFFKGFYTEHSRIPEYLTAEGGDPPDCGGEPKPADCLVRGFDNLFFGEARIYALAARLALELGDPAFAKTLIVERILSDRVDDKTSPSYGQIGASTADEGDAEAWNVLESVLTLCLEAGGR